MPEIMYSDIEVTAKIVMDPRTMEKALASINQLLNGCPNKREHGALDRMAGEMEQVLSRLAEMQVI